MSCMLSYPFFISFLLTVIDTEIFDKEYFVQNFDLARLGTRSNNSNIRKILN